MARLDINETIELPEGVKATKQGDVLSLKGEKGEISRGFPARAFAITVNDGAVTLAGKNMTKLQKNKLFTYKAHIKNMATGAKEGFTYKLKICSGHFPMSITIKDGKLEVKNFIGEKVPRVLSLKEGADVKIDGDVITVTSPDKERAGQVAADIEQLTKRSGFDKRVFQDGIYITEKAGKMM
ncbi:50S ribosomal protein L6 [Candidatus Woesearchaeota archaeon]|nr:50S ribosomal protein L6 [Candidatus Woesearchaeota archaeon]